MINFEDFKKLEIKIGTITQAEVVPETDKLLKLTVDLGDEQRVVVAGIAENHTPEDVEGKQVPVLVNLEPRTLRGIESQGMILAVNVDDKAILLHPDKEVSDGSQIR